MRSPESEGAPSDEPLLELRRLRLELPGDAAFRARLRARLDAEPAPRRSPLQWVAEVFRARPGLTWPAAGALVGAATFAMFFAIARPALTPAEGPTPPRFLVPHAKVAVIKLTFSAEVAIADATFEVELPEGLFFWSGGERLTERSFHWPGSLAAGDNLIPIAVRGERPGLYQVKARVKTPDGVVEQQVLLEVTKGAAG